jgi:Transglycosylase SLT domain
MANYSFAQLEQLWTANGGSAEWAPTMAAVALAESSGDPNAANPSGATGLWQVLSSAQSAAFNAQHPSSTMTNVNANAKAAIALLGNGSGISNWGQGTGDAVGTYVQQNGNKPLTAAEAQGFSAPGGNAQTAAAAAPVQTDAAVTSSADIIQGTPSGTGPDNTVTAGPTTFAPPIKGADVQDFHGIDLSAVPANELGNTEKLVQQYISGTLVVAGTKVDPQTIIQRGQQDYGYQGWMQKIPQLYGVMLAAVLGDWNENEVLGAVRDTQWYKTTDQNQRAWAQVQGTDPATAAQEVTSAQDKVLATANQLGVTLSKQELNAISNAYAANSATQGGVLGQVSGTSQEWLDQAVVSTILNINKTKTNQNLDYSTLATGQSTFGAQTSNLTNPSQLYGISSQLYQQFLGIAQQYLMYSPNNPNSLLKTGDIMKSVESALANFTGSGSFGSSNLINGAVQQFTAQMQQQASQMYPSLSGPIAQGTTPQSYAQPMATLIGNTLGLDPASIDFTSPQWNWAIATPQSGTNQKMALTQDQILQKITNPNFTFQNGEGQTQTFDNTNTAMQNMHSTTNSLAAMFGVGGT